MHARSLAAVPPRRYAIGVFDDWMQAEAFRTALIDGGVDSGSIGLFGTNERAGACECCGPFRGLARGSASPTELRVSLERWLLPLHACFLADAVGAGRVLVWVEITSFDQECGICLGMLKSSGRTVQIHDFDEPEGRERKSAAGL